MKALRIILGWLIGLITIGWRFSCRIQHHNDTRQALFEKKQPFVIAILHAHMITGILGKNPHSVVMASRSDDGDLIAPSIRCAGMRPVRGSSRKNDQSKGGGEALQEMSRLLEEEGYNPILTVDGPRGPRNYVHRGVAALALKHHCPVIALTAVSSKCRILHKTWDQTHIPLPLSTINMHWGEPLYPGKDESELDFRKRVGEALRQGELKLDSANAEIFDDTQIQFV